MPLLRKRRFLNCAFGCYGRLDQQQSITLVASGIVVVLPYPPRAGDSSVNSGCRFSCSTAQVEKMASSILRQRQCLRTRQVDPVMRVHAATLSPWVKSSLNGVLGDERLHYTTQVYYQLIP